MRLCEHAFVTAQPHPRVKFARAITVRNVFLAEFALGELETVLLEDALQLVTLYGEAGDPKYEAACRRYLSRWTAEDAPELADIAATPATSSSADDHGSSDSVNPRAILHQHVHAADDRHHPSNGRDHRQHKPRERV